MSKNNPVVWIVLAIGLLLILTMKPRRQIVWEPSSVNTGQVSGVADSILNFFKGLGGNTGSDSGSDQGPFGIITQSP